jgi:uncharacterized protein (DUF1501 family)
MEAHDTSNDMDSISRRRFLGEASCAAIGGGSVLASILNLKLAGTLAAEEAGGDDDYKALVCVFLQGGQDSYNMLVPRGDAEYAEYAGIRHNLALEKDSLLPIEAAVGDGRSYGLHPNLGGLKSMFDNDELAFVTNVGTLGEPTTKASYAGGLGSGLPAGLFSHADQERQWHTAMPDRSALRGWVGRMQDVLISLNGDNTFASSISLNGISLMQTGGSVSPYSIGPNGSRSLDDWGRFTWRHGTAGVTNQLELEYTNLLQKTYLEQKRNALEQDEVFSSALAAGAPAPLSLGSGTLADQLGMVYRTIAARQELGVRRQTFFVLVGGWDHHTELLAPHASMLQNLGDTLSNFNNALKGLGVADSVTTFTASDFGRSLTSNGTGSDHGWGGNQLAIGGAVNGGKLYGSYPELYVGNPLDVGRGRLIPTTAVDEYLAELACWFGVSRSQLPLVLPNLDRFYDLNSDTPPLGFMNLPT